MYLHLYGCGVQLTQSVVSTLTLTTYHVSFQLKVNLKYSCLPFELNHTLPHTGISSVIKKKQKPWGGGGRRIVLVYSALFLHRFTGIVRGWVKQLKVDFWSTGFDSIERGMYFFFKFPTWMLDPGPDFEMGTDAFGFVVIIKNYKEHKFFCWN
jgi:hypothetical protein